MLHFSSLGTSIALLVGMVLSLTLVSTFPSRSAGPWGSVSKTMQINGPESMDEPSCETDSRYRSAVFTPKPFVDTTASRIRPISLGNKSRRVIVIGTRLFKSLLPDPEDRPLSLHITVQRLLEFGFSLGGCRWYNKRYLTWYMMRKSPNAYISHQHARASKVRQVRVAYDD